MEMRNCTEIKNLIFFVTSRCNLRCRHCFNWQHLQGNTELELDKISNFVKEIPNLTNLNLSGGEPFIREDLSELCKIFSNACNLKALSIPSNGWSTEKIFTTTEKILTFLPKKTSFSVNISLDGLQEEHDKNRGREASFAHALETLCNLAKLKASFSNLRLNVSATLTKNNAIEIEKLSSFVKNELCYVDDFYWGLLRGTPSDKSVSPPLLEDVKRLDNKFHQDKCKRQNFISYAFEKNMYRLRRKVLALGKQPVPCVAGQNTLVLYENGDVALCEMLSPAGNINENSLAEIISSEKFSQMLTDVASGKCACTHECFLFPSSVHYVYNHLLSQIPRLALYALEHILKTKRIHK